MAKKNHKKRISIEIKQEIDRLVNLKIADSDKNKHRLTIITVVATSIMSLVAFFALIISVYNYKLNKDYQRETLILSQENISKSNEPYLSSILCNRPDNPIWDFIGLAIENKGFGPAYLSPALLLYDGKPVGLLEPNSLNSIDKILKCPKGVSRHIIHGKHILMPGERLMVFWSKKRNSKVIQDYFTDILKHVSFVYPYASLSGDVKKFAGIPGDGISDIIIGYPDKWFKGFKLGCPMMITGKQKHMEVARDRIP